MIHFNFSCGSRQFLPLLMLITLTGCSYIISPAVVRPNFETRTAALRAGEYKLDPAHSFLLFKIGHLDLATYVGRFNRFEATLDFDPAVPSKSALDALVFLDSLDVNDGDLETSLAEPEWLNTENYPEARFTSREIVTGDSESAENGQPELVITGDLTFRGMSKPVELVGRFNGGADNLLTGKYTLGFSATTSFSRADFGMTEFAGLIGDVVELEIFAEFQRLGP